MKYARAYLRADKIFIATFSKATTGLLIGTGPFYVITIKDFDRIGLTIISALEESKDQIPLPDRSVGKNIVKPLLDLAGVKSWKAFTKSAKSVGLTLEDNKITYTPTRNDGNGFVLINNDLKLYSTLNIDEVRLTLLKAFDISE